MYKLTSNGVIKLTNNAFIPNDNSNKDWQEYQKWFKVHTNLHNQRLGYVFYLYEDPRHGFLGDGALKKKSILLITL